MGNATLQILLLILPGPAPWFDSLKQFVTVAKISFVFAIVDFELTLQQERAHEQFLMTCWTSARSWYDIVVPVQFFYTLKLDTVS